MHYNLYIKNAIPISKIVPDAWQLGINSGLKNLNETEADKMVHTALDSGINFIYTTPNYGNRSSESRLG